MTPALRIAAAQFPVSGNIEHNHRAIVRRMKAAAARGARVVHFPEGALSGYLPKHQPAGWPHPWDQLARRTQAIQALAAQLQLRVVLGSIREMAGQRPRNCLWVVSDAGDMAGVYDKRRIYRAEQAMFSPGQGPCLFSIDGVRCGLLICYENCFAGLYEEYRRLGVQVLFHSFYNAGNRAEGDIQQLMWSSLIIRAADHGLWISAANSAERVCPLPACIVRPDGSFVRARRHTGALAIADFPGEPLGWTYDPRAP